MRVCFEAEYAPTLQSFSPIWTILQAPALNVPGFVGDSGMPIGLTLVSARYRDLHVLYVGKGIGEVFKAAGAS
jgi:Asp-tRNA(Asn)/Glu-tRNA(Gln) amidotransferase A subunit family amidase